MALTPEERAALVSYGHSPDGKRWVSYYKHTPLNEKSVERMANDHQPGLNYGGRGPNIPSCRHCTQSWPCDASRLIDTIRASQA